jgi:hypothetical protein
MKSVSELHGQMLCISTNVHRSKTRYNVKTTGPLVLGLNVRLTATSRIKCVVRNVTMVSINQMRMVARPQ